jgi:hypothetical protein
MQQSIKIHEAKPDRNETNRSKIIVKDVNKPLSSADEQ